MKKLPYLLLLVAAPVLAQYSGGGGSIVNPGGSSISVPVSAANGGTGDTLGRPIHPNQIPNATATPTATINNSLFEFAYSNPSAPGNVTAKIFQGTAAGHISAAGVVDTGGGITGSITAVYRGPHACTFDNQTVVGDWAVPSLNGVGSPVDGDCHDNGNTISSTQTIGQIKSLNSGAGTTAVVIFDLPTPVLVNNSIKGVSASSGTCGVSSTSTPTWGNYVAITVGTMPSDPGFASAEVKAPGGILDITTGATLPDDLCIGLVVNTGSISGGDQHCYGDIANAMPNTRYREWALVPLIAQFSQSSGGQNPLTAGYTLTIRCAQHNGTAITINTSSAGQFTLPDNGFEALFAEAPYMAAGGY